MVWALAELLGLTGVEVDVVERGGGGSWTVHVRTASGQWACCPGCGRAAGRAKEPTAHNVKHLALVPMRVTWHKSRFRCDSTPCQTRSFAEAGRSPRRADSGLTSSPSASELSASANDWFNQRLGTHNEGPGSFPGASSC